MLYLIPAPPSGRHWQWLVFIACFIIEGSVFIGRKAIFSRPFAVTAGADGLAWRRWGRRHTIPWHEVRALGMIESTGWSWSPTWSWNSIWSISLPAHLAYWVRGTHDTLMFMPALPGQRLPPLVENDVSGAGDPAWQLCATVGAKTGLPLRDLTPAAMRMTSTWTRVRYRDYWRNLLVVPQGIASSTCGRLRYGIRTLAPLLLFVALLVAGLGMLVVQPRAYAARLAQAQSTKALLSDSMMKPSGLWPVGTTSRATYTYLSDGYWLGLASEVCCDVYALAPPTFHTATVEATVHQVSSFDLSEAGLVVRADDIAHTMLIIVVTPNGEWHLKRFHIQPDGTATDEQTLMYESTLGGVAAIHQGRNATNRLAVMMRGTSYTFFINGQFVGGYQGEGLTSGHVGFYSDLLSEGVGFSDFVVYPAPPPSPLFPV
jgi:hypothetical protein